jgi:hypothetical protein
MKLGRNTKRAVIIFVYLLIFSLLGLAIYFAVRPVPSCSDGKLNQREDGIDCGGPCQACAKPLEAEDISVKEEAFVFAGPNRYDGIVKISNPNTQYGSPLFSYKVQLKDGAGKVLTERSGTGFILPSETKYILEMNLESVVTPESVDFSIESINWEEFFEYREKPMMGIYNRQYSPITSGVGFSEVYGLLRNESPFDFNVIKIKIVLRDGTGKAVAANSTELRSVRSSEQRDFKLIWPLSFPGEVAVTEIEPEANVYDSENFMEKYFPQKQFQKLR